MTRTSPFVKQRNSNGARAEGVGMKGLRGNNFLMMQHQKSNSNIKSTSKGVENCGHAPGIFQNKLEDNETLLNAEDNKQAAELGCRLAQNRKAQAEPHDCFAFRSSMVDYDEYDSLNSNRPPSMPPIKSPSNKSRKACDKLLKCVLLREMNDDGHREAQELNPSSGTTSGEASSPMKSHNAKNHIPNELDCGRLLVLSMRLRATKCRKMLPLVSRPRLLCLSLFISISLLIITPIINQSTASQDTTRRTTTTLPNYTAANKHNLPGLNLNQHDLWSINGNQLSRDVRDNKRLRSDYYSYLYQSAAQKSADNFENSNIKNNETTVNFASSLGIESSCTKSRECSLLKGAHCDRDSNTCTCLPYHVQLDSKVCLPAALLGDKCQLDSQCELKVANSSCQDGICRCLPASDKSKGFITVRKDKCLPGSKLNDYCVSDEHCRLEDAHAFCKWHIPRVYGICKCPANYRQLEIIETSQETSQSQSQNLNATRAAKIKCAPRLGDSCLSSGECHWTNPGWVCREPTDLELSSFKWKSSGASSTRCLCKRPNTLSPNKLDCVTSSPLQDEQANSAHNSFTLAIANSMNQKHEYQLVQQLTTTQTPPPATSTKNSILHDEPSRDSSDSKDHLLISKQSYGTPSTPTPVSVNYGNKTLVRPSSLGKACASSAECQARDINSACISGICECLRPSARCRAASTGCHRDTFQCRSSGLCISWYFVCDHFNNCDDGSDEQFCFDSSTTTGRPSGQCPSEAFKCGDGSGCLSRSKVCNGQRDCLDASDELGCNPAAQEANFKTTAQGQQLDKNVSIIEQGGESQSQFGRCPRGSFECADGRQCLPNYVFCNSVADCRDSSDERWHLCDRLLDHRHQAAALDQWPASLSKNNGKPPLIGQGAESAGSAAGLLPARDHESWRHGPPAPSGLDGEAGPANSPLVKADRPSIERLLAQLHRNRQQQQQQQTANGKPARTGRAKLAAAWASSGGGGPQLTSIDGQQQEQQQQQTRAQISGEFIAGHPNWTPPMHTTGTSRATPIDNRHERAIVQNGNSRQRSQKQRELGRERERDQAFDRTTRGPPEESECPAWAFTCRNGRCRSSAVLCSGVDGCGDNSDEDRCEVCRCEAP